MRLKRYCMPRTWRMERKTHTWATKPRGPHSMETSMSLQMIVRDMLKLADTGREAKKIISQGKVLVDKKEMKDHKFGAGLMDVIEIPELKKAYRVVKGSRGIQLIEVKDEKMGTKLCRIQGKKSIKGGIFQLNLHDGRNMLLKDAKAYNLNDSLVISLPDQKIVRHYRMENGAPAFILSGRNAGASGRIKEIRLRKNMLEKSTVIVQTKEKEVLTLLEYVMAGECE